MKYKVRKYIKNPKGDFHYEVYKRGSFADSVYGEFKTKEEAEQSALVKNCYQDYLKELRKWKQ